MRVLVWHVHGSWAGSFVRGGHTYLLPRVPEGGTWGRGRSGRDWPPSAVEVGLNDLPDLDVDAVVLQRPGEIELVRRYLGREPGRDVPAVYVEHNTPPEHPVRSRHPMADRSDVDLVHVTHFNALMWDNGDAPVTVVPHGIPDPGARYDGDLARVATLINEPRRRGRITGTDLLPHFAAVAPVDVFGIGTEELDAGPGVHGRGDLGQEAVHDAVARRRVYLHTARWTSLGLSLLEAMALGMPVVAPATTEAPVAVPPEAGVCSTDLDELVAGVRRFVADPALAAATGKAAREHVLAHFGLPAFLRRWDDVLAAATTRA